MTVIQSAKDLEDAVLAYGFLPFFKNEIRGFSVEEMTPPAFWFPKEGEGPWDWKGPVARKLNCMYGKFLRGRAAFVSREWIPDLVNYRRDGYDFDSCVDEELVSYRERRLYEAISAVPSILSVDLKNDCGCGKDGFKDFDRVITSLQMRTYVCIRDFDYMLDRHGAPYGWGIARYSTPEAVFGKTLIRSAYRRAPETSLKRILAHMTSVWPAEEREFRKLFRG